MCVVSLCSSGCRLWDLPVTSQLLPSQERQQTSRLTDILADALDSDAWTENQLWSPVTERQSPLRKLRNAQAESRWLFRPVRQKQTTGAGIDKNSKRPTARFSLEDIVRAYSQSEDNSATTSDSLNSDEQDRSTATTPRTALEEAIITQLALIADRDDLAGWNATILLAQRDPVSARQFVPVLARLTAEPPLIQPNSGTLTATQQSRRISRNMRAAAAEAWCLVLATAETDGEQAMHVPGLILEDHRRSRQERQILTADLPVTVEADLIRGVARRVAPARIPEISRMLKRPLPPRGEPTPDYFRRVELHQAAIDACVVHAVSLRGSQAVSTEHQVIDLRNEAVWPRVLWTCVDDPAPKVRAALGLLLAVTRDHRALEVLTDQISDTKPEVQSRALQNLGLLQNEAALKQLREYMTRESLLRKTAVQGLAAYGEQELVKYLDDEDARVREELARQLTPYQSRTSAVALATLMTDSVTAVQSAVLAGIEIWPDELLLPLLLHGGVEGNYRTRFESLRIYSERTDTVVPPFRADDDYPIRQDKAARTAQRARLAYPLTRDVLASAGTAGERFDRERVAEIERRLQIAVSLGGVAGGGFESEWLRQLSPADLSAVEQVLQTSDRAGRDYLFREVLPLLAPEYDALLDIDHTQVTKRRAAAARLREIGYERSLRDAVWERLGDVLVREEDATVWRDVMGAIGRDTAEPVTRIVQLAVNHRWADVRRMGCEYISRHGRADFAPWMQRLFEDPHPTVQLAAIKAAGHCGQQRVLEDAHGEKGEVTMIGLSRLLNSFSGERHLAVVESMSRLLDPRGLEELHRLSYSGNWRTRLAAIEIMAEIGQTRFLDRLIDVVWLDQEPRPEVKRAALKAIETLIPADEHPDKLESAQTPQQKAEVWHLWWERRSRKNLRNPTPTAGIRYNRTI